ncbi:DRTGG domain-containing protein [Paenibacillus dakarensis]|uniref:DRTGG domain-containing protein n=1 Tax=Paenibacillus dakarensis TaxID=1527293 RepID=UPI0006D57AA4|nr:DRTGG domain-containing protein [Paenibacillus dakarensis]
MSSSNFSTKHEQIIQYIESLDIGSKISVRKIAQELDVSEGTAYRAMKDAENKGIVAAKERAGTFRIEKKQPVEIDRLTFSEIVNIVDGRVIGGEEGLHKTLKKFVIGAMQLEDMIRYIEPGNLLIVGNREKAHFSALTLGAGILITGGFDTSDAAKALADELKLPVISTHYDTFTVATMINRVISDKLIKKTIVHVKDAVHPEIELAYLQEHDQVGDMLRRISETNHNRFPVIDEARRPVGIITAKDIIGAGGNEPVHQYMTPDPLTVTEQTAVATAGHMMVRESLELLPIVNASGQLTGVISRKDVLRSLQNTQLQPHYGETLEEQIWSSFKETRDDQGITSYQGVISASMINPVGNLSDGILSCLINQATARTISKLKKGNLHIDSTAVHYFLPVEIDSSVTLLPTVIESNRRFCKVGIDVYVESKRVAQAIVTARLFEA